MHKVNKRLLMILLSLCFASLVAGVSLIYSENRAQLRPTGEAQMPIFLAHLGSSPTLERPPVGFDHDLHTAALKQSKIEDCAVCHVLKETDKRLINPEVKIFGFPKDLTGRTDKTAIMYSYHNQCVACHQKTGSEGKKSGPDIGLCGKCHVRRADVTKTAWTWSPLFNYARHAKHAEAAKQFDASEGLNVVDKIQVIGEIPDSKKGCLVCHHIYDEGLKKLVYKNDTENSCRACHKAEDIQNARSMKKVAHAACVGCHMKLAERAKQEALRQGRAELTEQERKRFGPFVCKGCHGEHKELTPDQIVKTPRLDRGQKDMIDVALGAVESSTVQKIQQPLPVSALPVRMKAVPFNHKSHETRTQFCNTCHHHSLEKCDKCHTPAGDSKKGGGITYERAFHKPDAQQSCVGCHSAAKEDKKCAGCHQWMKTGLPQSSCQVCHRGPSEGKIVEKVPTPLFQDKEKVPERLQLKLLEREFKPAEMPHMKIVNKLVSLSNESSLARRFHGATEQTLCSGCHHRSELQQAAIKAPKCSTCHNRSFDPKALGRPGLSAAYHRQCIGCHEAMNQKPAALECVKCHPAKEPVQTKDLIPPVAGLR